MATPNSPDEANDEIVRAELIETSATHSAGPTNWAGPGAVGVYSQNMTPQIVAAENIELVAMVLKPNLAAVGGAVGSCVLGVWSILGSLFTPYSAINGIFGILLGLWGIQSPRFRLSILGTVLAVIGFFMSLLRIPVAAAIEALMNENAVLFLQSTLQNHNG